MKKYGYDERNLSDIKKLAGRGSKVMLTRSMHELAEMSGKIKKTDDEIEEIEQGLEKLTQESFQSTSVETTTGGGFTTTYKDGTVVRTEEDGTETVISGPTA